ncbi:MAG: tetratricopeptide repeat protein [Sedimenticola sp.]
MMTIFQNKRVSYWLFVCFFLIISSNVNGIDQFRAQKAQKNSAPWIGEEFSGAPCRGKRQGFGPYDYLNRSVLKGELIIVEGSHFTPEVEALVRGKTGVEPLSDTDYTLRAWPNHHRALNSVTRYHFQQKKKGIRLPTPPECYYMRAINFSPKDATTYMLYAMYLHKSGKMDDAEEKYNKALEIKPNDIQIHYNYGLYLVDRKRFEDAKHHAEIVYSYSFPLSGLKNKLRNAGYWP